MNGAQEDRFAFVAPYVAVQAGIALEEERANVDSTLKRIGNVHPVRPGSRLLEFGVGSGRFLVLCAQRGLECHGVEHNPLLCRQARKRAADAGVKITVREGDVTAVSWPRATFDIVIANSILEHVPVYRRVLESAYCALRPGGVLFFNSTNRFAPRSGEYPPIPFYGLCPFPVRRAIRVRRQGPGVLASSSIDFHQFTHGQLRRDLREIGFGRIYSLHEMLAQEDPTGYAGWRRLAIRALGRWPGGRRLLETFTAGTAFFCAK